MYVGPNRDPPKFGPFFRYLIDFDISRYDKDYKPITWEDLVSCFHHPDAILQLWELETRELRKRLESHRQVAEQSQSASRSVSRGLSQT